MWRKVGETVAWIMLPVIIIICFFIAILIVVTEEVGKRWR